MDTDQNLFDGSGSDAPAETGMSGSAVVRPLRTGKRFRAVRPLRPHEIALESVTEIQTFREERRRASVLIERTALMNALMNSSDARLVTLVAGPGFGKTVVMQQYQEWLRARGTNVAWMTTSICDDRYERFLTALSRAMSEILGESGAAELLGLACIGPAGEQEIAGTVRDMLNGANQPFVLFIDGFEVIKNPEIALFMRLFVSFLPRGSQVVLAARRHPCLLLGSFRARGELIEIEQPAFCFTREETAAACERAGLRLADDDIEKLHRATNGWPAVLRLINDALKATGDVRSFIASCFGSSPIISEFLSEELVGREAPETRAFLLRASILGELNAPLCNAVCRTDASEDLLRTIDGAKAYVTAQNPERSQFRFQPLVRAYLQRELIRQLPGEVNELHLAAARWFRAQGRIGPAMNHALESGDTTFALSLLNSCAESLLCEGRSRVLTAWFHRLPAAALQPHYRLRVVRIWALTTIRRSDEGLRLLEEMQTEPGHELLSGTARLELAGLKALILAVMDRAPDASWLVRAELAKLPAEDSVVRRILVTTLAQWKVASNEFAEAIAFAQMYQYRDGQGAVSSSYYATFIEGLIALAQCRVRQSIAHFRVALTTSTRAFRSVISLHLAEALYEIGEIDEARQLLEQTASAISDFGHSDHLSIGHVLRARIAHAAGDVDQAFLQLSELENLARHANLPRALAGAQLERARISMLNRDADSALAHYQRARRSDVWCGARGLIMPANDVETPEMCAYRLHVHGFTNEDVIASLTADYKTAHGCGRHRRALRLNLMLAKALHLAGQTRQAMRTVEASLRVAMQDGLTRAFLDEGAPIIDLVRIFRVTRRGVTEGTGDARLNAFIDEILTVAGIDLDVKSAAIDCVSDAPVMTARELQILTALASGLSNIKIAERLFVTETTVRSHLRKISAKFGTSSRIQAVCVARRFGLV